MEKETYIKLLKMAGEVSNKAYAPYSKFKVGASVLFEDGSIYTGCNVENSSYGLALCAERNAISTAIADGNLTKPVIIAIKSPNRTLCYPCGACRQWVVEFNKDAEVVLEDKDGNPVVFKISELLPCTFDL